MPVEEPSTASRAVLAYLSRYTHRVAISNSRLLKSDGGTVTFRVKNYRVDGAARYTTMTLAITEFIRRFLLHVLPKGQHRIRHYGLFANGTRADNVVLARKLLGVTEIVTAALESMHDPEATNAEAATAEPELLHTDLSVLRQQNAHHRDLQTRPDTPLQSLAEPAIDPDRYVMTIVMDARQIAAASSWSEAGFEKPLPIYCSRSHRAPLSHSKAHHRNLSRAPRSSNTSPPGAITASHMAGQVPNYP